MLQFLHCQFGFVVKQSLKLCNGGETANKSIADAHKAAFEVINSMESFDEYKQVSTQMAFGPIL